MQIKQSLIKELDAIVELTTKQNEHYVRSRQYLYEGLPLLSGLVDVDIVGKITISVTESCVAIAYATELADYQVFVPSCAANGKRIKVAFQAYGG